MKANRRVWLDFLAAPGIEGGYVDDPHDRGGPTNYGVTQATLARWRGRPVTVEEVKALGRDEAEAIASANYWNKVQGDRLPPGLDVMVADCAYNSGPGTAVELLQRLLGVTVDGHVGPETLAACLRHEAAALVEDYHHARLDHLEGLDGWKRFGGGWSSRCFRLLNIAAKLALTQKAPEPASSAKVKIDLGAAVAAAGAVVTGGPEIADAYRQATQATEPLAALAAWLPQAVGLAVAIAVIVGLAIKARRLADAVS